MREVLIVSPCAADVRERALHGIGELGLSVARERGVTGLPRLLVEVGLDGVQILKGGRDAGMGVGLGLGRSEGT